MQKSVRTEESTTTATTTAVPLYTGVDIKVSFTRSGKPQRVHQLSGGQQSLVALALIFAIQRCDPAPFYVFDEIDSALDDTYRLAIAEMIRAQSDNNKIQFIITTHRPEMVNHAHKHYLIEYKNKVSNVVSCSQADALQLLEGEEDIPINREKDSVGEESDRSFDETV
jgi:structural maintenance of chromosome 3 (chondroitin sulfate proteoglycan 6)